MDKLTPADDGLSGALSERMSQHLLLAASVAATLALTPLCVAD